MMDWSTPRTFFENKNESVEYMHVRSLRFLTIIKLQMDDYPGNCLFWKLCINYHLLHLLLYYNLNVIFEKHKRFIFIYHFLTTLLICYFLNYLTQCSYYSVQKTLKPVSYSRQPFFSGILTLYFKKIIFKYIHVIKKYNKNLLQNVLGLANLDFCLTKILAELNILSRGSNY